MSEDRVFDPDSLREGVLTAGQPPVPASELPSDAYEVEVIVTRSDGTSTLTSTEGLSRYPDELASVSFPPGGPPVQTLAPRDAAILGLYHLIAKIRWHSIDLEALVKTSASQARVSVHTLDRVFFDWPDWSKEIQPAQSALITAPEQATFDGAGFQARLLEDTADRFKPNTMLRYLGEQQVPLLLVFWSAHKDQRRGLEAKVAQTLAAERHDDKMGRRIVLPEYFSRTIRYTLQNSERPDGADAARGNEWQLAFEVLAEVPHVELVWSPGYVEQTRVIADASP